MGAVESRRWLLYVKNLFNMRQILDHISTPGNYRKLFFGGIASKTREPFEILT
jgi:hypothetical protein